jgi:hypothetical protein
VLADHAQDVERDRVADQVVEASVQQRAASDLQADRLKVHREPRGARYERTLILQCGEVVAPEAFPDGALAAADLLG